MIPRTGSLFLTGEEARLLYDFLRIQNRDILFMTSPKVNISNLKRKLIKFYIQNIFEFLESFSSRVTSCST